MTCPPHTKGNKRNRERKQKGKLPVRPPKINKDPPREKARKLTKQQSCVMLRKKNTRIGNSKKGEKYTRMKCVCEKREHVKST